MCRRAPAADLMKVGVPAQIITSDKLATHASTPRSRARPSAIDPQARTFRAEIDVPNPNSRWCRACMCRWAFLLDNRGLMQVPAAALVFRSGHPQVAVVDRSDTVHFRNVTIGRDDGSTVELQSGVVAGEQLVLNISNQMVDGEKVQMREEGAAHAGEPPGAHRHEHAQHDVGRLGLRVRWRWPAAPSVPTITRRTRRHRRQIYRCAIRQRPHRERPRRPLTWPMVAGAQ